MTTRTITGTYSAGYTLSPTYSQIRVAPTGEIGGVGLSASAAANVLNQGSVVATGYGVNGVDLRAGGVLINSAGAMISGGVGAIGGNNGNVAIGGQGGGGAVLSVHGLVTNNGIILGGAGGRGGYYRLYYVGLGGQGGAALTIDANASRMNNLGTILGGVGGEGRIGGISGDGVSVEGAGAHLSNSGAIFGGLGGYSIAYFSNGGAGGAGLATAATDTNLINRGTIAGGAGGQGTTGYDSNFPSAYGGTGGAGFVSSARNTTLSNAGAILGGEGGGGYQGGAGGGGSLLMTSGAVVVNSGDITGGAGQDAARPHRYQRGAAGGDGGVGLTLAMGGRVVNAGTISGGNGGKSSIYPNGGGVGGDGMTLSGSISLTNNGLIAGGNAGAFGDGAGGSGVSLKAASAGPDAAEVFNSGTIMGGAGSIAESPSYQAGIGGDGALLFGSVIVVNKGAISGGQGGQGGGGAYGTPQNGGVGGTGGVGLCLSGHGEISNTGVVLGGQGGAGGVGGTGKSNGPTGSTGDGVVMMGGDMVNGAVGIATALISGSIGIYAGGAATITNFGTVAGSTGVSVQFESASGRLIAEAGSTFIGVVNGHDGTLELASGGGTITGLGLTGTITGAVAMTFDSVSNLILDNASAWTMSGANTVRNGQTLTAAFGSKLTIGGASTLNVQGTVSQAGNLTVGDTTNSAASVTVLQSGVWKVGGNIARGTATASQIINNGLLIRNAGAGTSMIYVTTVDNGMIEAAAGTLDFTRALSGTGAMKIDAGATLEADGGAASSLSAAFNGAGATLALKQAAAFAAKISGFTSGDTIDLLGATATGASVNGADQLVIVNGTTTVATLQLSGSYAGDTFGVGSDGTGGTNVTLSTAPSPHLLTAAMAAMAPLAGLATAGHNPVAQHAPLLATPGASSF